MLLSAFCHADTSHQGIGAFLGMLVTMMHMSGTHCNISYSKQRMQRPRPLPILMPSAGRRATAPTRSTDTTPGCIVQTAELFACTWQPRHKQPASWCVMPSMPQPHIHIIVVVPMRQKGQQLQLHRFPRLTHLSVQLGQRSSAHLRHTVLRTSVTRFYVPSHSFTYRIQPTQDMPMLVVMQVGLAETCPM